jgi:hypothetical protein
MSREPSSGAQPASAPGHPGNPPDASRENEMIGSLGEALAGVNLGPNSSVHNNGFSFHSDHGVPFQLASSQPNNTAGGDLGWGFNDTTRSGFAGNNGGREDPNLPPEPSTPERDGKKSIDLFLSQSPSQMLGNDVFKLSTGNLPSLARPEADRTSSDLFRQPLGQGHGHMSASPGSFAEARRKNESPSSAVTGTTTSSRSGSPYANADGSRGIGAYHGYDNSNSVAGETLPPKRNPSFAEEDRSGGYGMSQGHGSRPDNNNNQRMQSPYNKNNSNSNIMGGQSYSPAGFGSGYEQGTNPNSPQVKQANGANPQQQQQQQVLYMAVPTPDGRGQVLQPVQMVQLPGNRSAYVVPGGAGHGGGMPAMQGAPEGQQPMMVLPNNMQMQQQQQQQPPVQSNDLVNNLISGNGRNNNQNRATGYSNASDNNQYAENPASGLRGDDYNTLGQGGIAGGNQFNPNMPSANQEIDPLTSLYSTPQRPSLDALLGQVRRLSRDQVGCRLVQQALDEEGTMAATLILNEGLPFWGEAMVDPFGNYLFQKILEKITSEERVMLIKSVSTRLVNASLNLHGTRSVQKIVELCSIDDEKGEPKDSDESAADILTRALAPAAARLCIDSHGNHVIQRILLKLGHKHAQFVFDAVAESVGDVARHRHGCCVIQRCLDSPPSPARSHLVRRIVAKALELMQDAYGNYVVQYVLDVCSDDDVHAVCEAVIGKISLLAIQKFSSNVMEKCLERCTDRVKEHYMQELSNPERIRELMMDPFGNYVVQRALSVSTHAQAVRLVEAMRPHLLASAPGTPNGQRNGGVRNTAGGRRIMAKICRRFPNFTLNAVGTTEELYSQNKGHHRHQHQQQHHNPVMAQGYAQLSPGPQNYHPHHQQHQHYNGNPHAVNVQPYQVDQRQPYYDIGDTGYFQQAPHMGHGAYPSGL